MHEKILVNIYYKRLVDIAKAAGEWRTPVEKKEVCTRAEIEYSSTLYYLLSFRGTRNMCAGHYAARIATANCTLYRHARAFLEI